MAKAREYARRMLYVALSVIFIGEDQMRHPLARLALGIALLLATVPASAQQKDPTGSFDYYVLSLSWSPQYCANAGDQKQDPQCSAGRRYGFVMHGLWPQYAKGGWPQFCVTPPARVSDATIDTMMQSMPSRSLILHEWAKHGTCSHLGPDDYFKDAAAAYHAVAIPKDYQQPKDYVTTTVAKLVADFTAANPGLDPGEVSAYCKKQYLVELRLCLSKDFKPTACGRDGRSQCGDAVVLRPVK